MKTEILGDRLDGPLASKEPFLPLRALEERDCVSFPFVPLVYCDHNFVVSSHDSADEYRTRLRELAVEGRVNFVLSTWHWLEMARDNDRGRGLSVAAFADSLAPRWFFDRRGVQRREVECAFWCFLDIESPQQSMIGSLGEAIADLTRTPLAIANTYGDSRAFVEHMQALGDDHPINANIRNNLEKQRQNGEAYRAGRVTDEMIRRMDRTYIGGLLPKQTPSGIVIDRMTKDNFLGSCNNNDFPSYAVEAAFSLDGWRTGRILNDRAFRDSQHVVAIPYLDTFVTDDGAFATAIRRVAGSLPFPTAEIIPKHEFDRRFL